MPMPLLWTTEATIFIWITATTFTQREQQFLWFIANNDRNTEWGYNAEN